VLLFILNLYSWAPAFSIPFILQWPGRNNCYFAIVFEIIYGILPSDPVVCTTSRKFT
jgi:hypothetical protein